MNTRNLLLINVIFGGTSTRDDSAYVRKTNARQVFFVEVGQKRASQDFDNNVIISFSKANACQNLCLPHDNSIMIDLGITDYLIKKVLVNMKSFLNILFHHALEKIGINFAQVRPIKISLIGFLGKHITIEGTIILLIKMGTSPNVNLNVNFMVIKLPFAYKAILNLGCV